MHIHDIFAEHETSLSFEFFPPKTDKGWDNLFASIKKLEPLAPAFVSVTYGAGGSTRQQTHDLVVRIKETTSLRPVPHLTCVCHRQEEIEEILLRYAKAGVGTILALGGDPPRDRQGHDRSQDAFQHAADLVAFIQEFNRSGRHPDPRGFAVGAACFPEGHPATPNRLEEMAHLKAKVDAGVDYLCTQLFFDNRDLYDFRDRCALAGIDVPIIAGIMPVTTVAGMDRMAELAAGSRFPAKLLKALDRVKDDPEAVKNVGVHWATEQCLDLLDNGVRGIHFYTLNKSDATLEIYRNLGLSDGERLSAQI